MDGLSIITSIIIPIIELLIFLSPFILGWIGYSYIFSKLIYSFAKHYFNINISFSRTWAITFLSGIPSSIILYGIHFVETQDISSILAYIIFILIAVFIAFSLLKEVYPSQKMNKNQIIKIINQKL